MSGFFFAGVLPATRMSKPAKHPKVQITSHLRKGLEDDGFDADDYIECFRYWKSLGPSGEFADPYFGKDGEYARPLRNGKRVLRHVHLEPESDPLQLAAWRAAHKRGSRKTSDAHLIYAADDVRGYLLIEIVREPRAHEVASMTSGESERFMNALADIAEAFIHDGRVLI